VFVEVVTFVVLRAGYVGSENTAGLKSDINHHLEHINDVVLDARASEVSLLLVIVHLHVTATHLDHTVVDSLIGMLKSFQICIFEGQ